MKFTRREKSMFPHFHGKTNTWPVNGQEQRAFARAWRRAGKPTTGMLVLCSRTGTAVFASQDSLLFGVWEELIR